MTGPGICFIGFGEAGQALAAGLRTAGVRDISAWDILFPDPRGESLRRACDQIGVRAAKSAAEAVRDAELVFSAVTAASSFEAAQSAVPSIGKAAFFLDINSVSPGRKQQTAALFADAGRYVDVAVMAAVHPARHQTPMLLAGPHAQALEPLLLGMQMKVSIAGPDVGAAAAIKMVRSVMVKGLEALTFECFLAAARAGVEEQVTSSLSKSHPEFDWKTMVDYNLERMTSHGIRRAAELHEVADTLRELGVEPRMTEAAAKHQQQLGELGRRAPASSEPTGRLRALVASLAKQAN